MKLRTNTRFRVPARLSQANPDDSRVPVTRVRVTFVFIALEMPPTRFLLPTFFFLISSFHFSSFNLLCLSSFFFFPTRHVVLCWIYQGLLRTNILFVIFLFFFLIGLGNLRVAEFFFFRYCGSKNLPFLPILQFCETWNIESLFDPLSTLSFPRFLISVFNVQLN